MAVRYTGKLASNGKIFDQTKGKKTFAFRVGANLDMVLLTAVGIAHNVSPFV